MLTYKSLVNAHVFPWLNLKNWFGKQSFGLVIPFHLSYQIKVANFVFQSDFLEGDFKTQFSQSAFRIKRMLLQIAF